MGNVYINANEDLSNNGIAATIALQNKVEQDVAGSPGAGNVNGRVLAADANPEFSGEIASTVCGIVNVVACAPAGTDNRNHFVVSPRLSDGQVTSATPVNNRKRFYVTISGDSADLTDAGKAIPAVALPANPSQN